MVNSQVTVIPQQRTKGIILVLLAAILWGISGTVAQFLFHIQGFSVQWLVGARLLSSGILLLWFSQKIQKQTIWMIWKTKRDIFQLFLFGILGMLGVQYTYFAAIQTGNAATATVLQYLAPVLICCYLCVRSKQWPAKHELSAIIFALAGTFLLVTNGNLNALSISGPAFFWGILSAFALAFYTVYPSSLLSKWGSMITVGWGMLIGGIGLSLIYPPWQFQGNWSLSSIAAVLFVIIFGTLIAFICFMESLKFILPSEASLIACTEPLSAAFLAVVWLQVSFSFFEWAGAFCIILTIFILSAVKR